MKTLITIAATVAALTFAGCGDDPKDAEDYGDVYSYDKQAGRFVDSPVTGITVKTPHETVVTDSEGNFRYTKGDTAKFYIGNIYLGSVDHPIYTTPNEFAITRAEKVNQLRFIQALDSDGNLDNGIQIVDAAVNITGQTVIWSNEQSVIDTLRNISIDAGLGSNGLTLVSEVDAVNHFETYNHMTLD